jgi:hypothetical protein
MMVSSRFIFVWRSFNLATGFDGRKPKNVKLLLASPEEDKAVMRALGPGIGTTSMLTFLACVTR